MLNRIVLALAVATLALPVAAAEVNPPSVFFDFSSTQASRHAPGSHHQPAAWIAGRVELSPSLGRMKLRGDRRVSIAGDRQRDDAVLILILGDDDTFKMRYPGGDAFRGKVRQAAASRRKLDLFLFPPLGQRFIEETTARSFGAVARPAPFEIPGERVRIVAKINSDGDRVKLKILVPFQEFHDGELVTGVVRLVLMVDLED